MILQYNSMLVALYDIFLDYYKKIIRAKISDNSLKLLDITVERINQLNKNGLLKDVQLIDEVKQVYPQENEKEKT